jgi:hypothetical protein
MKLKEQGLKPKKKRIHTEPGTRDCGDDITSLGPDIYFLAANPVYENFPGSDDSEDETMLPVYASFGQKVAHTYNVIATLCYGVQQS